MQITFKKRQIMFIVLFIILIVFVCMALILGQPNGKVDPSVMITYCINCVISVIGLVISVSRYAYSVNFIFWLFSVFFLGLAPMMQFINHKYSWGLWPSNVELTIINLFVLVWYISYIVGHFIRFKLVMRRNTINRVSPRETKYIVRKEMLDLLLLLSICVTIYCLKEIGFLNMLIRDTNVNMDLNGTGQLLTRSLTHNTVWFCLAFHILAYRQGCHSKVKLVISAVCFLLVCFPTGISRAEMATSYCGLLLILFPRLKRTHFFTIVFIAGLILVFPILTLFRNLYLLRSHDFGEYFRYSIQGNFLSGDYDAYQNFVVVYRWISSKGITFGRQLLGALLFFVPRVLWTSKPYGTGATSFQVMRQNEFTNVSCVMPAEGYANFGILGIVLFGVAFGIIARYFDSKYWQSDNQYSALSCMYPSAVLQTFALLRGDLMSNFSGILPFCMFGLLYHRFVFRREISQ